MHGSETVAAVLRLRESGLGARRISAQTGVPIRTVTDWLAGRTPRGGTADEQVVCSRCGARSHVISDAPAYAYLLGLYLGDGYVAPHPRGVFRLRITLDEAYPSIVDSCCRAIGALVPNNKVLISQREGCVDVGAYSKGWPCFFPQSGAGPKHTRPIVLAWWQRFYAEEYAAELLRGLIHSDGCRSTNHGRKGWTAPRYSFTNRSADIRRIFCDSCDILGLRWTAAAPDRIYVSRVADVARMDEFIGPKR